MFKKKKIVFFNHPYIKGYAVVKGRKQVNLVFSLIGKTKINSQEFELLQNKALKKGYEVVWDYL